MLRVGSGAYEFITGRLKLRNEALMIEFVYLLKTDDIGAVICNILKYFALAVRGGGVKKKVGAHNAQISLFIFRQIIHGAFLSYQRLKATSISLISSSLIGTIVPCMEAISQSDSAPNSRTSRRS